MNTDDFDTIGDMPTVPGDGGEEKKLLADRYKIIRKLGENQIDMTRLEKE